MPEFTRPATPPPDSYADLPEKEFRRRIIEDLRTSMEFVAQQFKTRTDAMLRDPRFSDERVASGLRMMQGVVNLDKAVRPNPGDVMYTPDGIHGMWGQAGAPSPTDPGTGPAGGVTDGDKGDITVTGSGATWTIDNDVVTFAKMQNVTGPVLIGRHDGSAGDLSAITIPTRKEYYHHTDLFDLNATAGQAIVGTPPDAYSGWVLGPTDRVDLGLIVPVSNLWRTGNVSVALIWSAGTQEASNWQPVAESLTGAAGTINLVGAGSDMAPAAVSANVTQDVGRRTTVGSFAVSAAADLIRLVVGRDPGAGGDSYTGSVYLVGVELTFTPIY